MSETLKRDWFLVLCAGAVFTWLFLRRKQAVLRSPATAEPTATVEIPNAAATPDYLSYNLPAFQKPALLAGVAPVERATAPVSSGGPVMSSELRYPSEFPRPSISPLPAQTGCCCGENRGCGESRGGNLVANQDHLISQLPPDLAGKMAANLLSAFPSATVQYEP